MPFVSLNTRERFIIWQIISYLRQMMSNVIEDTRADVLVLPYHNATIVTIIMGITHHTPVAIGVSRDGVHGTRWHNIEIGSSRCVR